MYIYIYIYISQIFKKIIIVFTLLEITFSPHTKTTIKSHASFSSLMALWGSYPVVKVAVS